jgi:hypothetical protein
MLEKIKVNITYVSIRRCIFIISVQQCFVMYDNINKTDKIMCEHTDRNFLTQDMVGPGATLLKCSKINDIPFNSENLLLAHQEFCSTYLYMNLKLKTTNNTYCISNYESAVSFSYH